MTKPIVISVRGEPQGVVVPTGSDFRFMAVKLGVFPLEGQLFASIEAARAAAEEVVENAARYEVVDPSGEGDDLVA